MKKNVAGQIVGAEVLNGTAAFAGSVTVYVTGDGGTQAVGTVGSGATTHEGNGFHTYAPSQAETNYDQVAFTFVPTSGRATTVTLYPRETYVPVNIKQVNGYTLTGDGDATPIEPV